MIITRTPLRISFAGGGTDLPSFYRHHGGGAVTSAAIDRYVHVLVNEKFDQSIRIAYSRTENVDRLEELQHGSCKRGDAATGVTDSLEVHTIADIPGEGTGLGSSSSLTVGLLNALYALRGVLKDPAELAEEACQIEIDGSGARSASRTSTSPRSGDCATSSSAPTTRSGRRRSRSIGRARRSLRAPVAVLHRAHATGRGVLKGQERADQPERRSPAGDGRPRRPDARRVPPPGLGRCGRAPGRGLATQADPRDRDLERADRRRLRPGEGGWSVGRQDYRRRRRGVPPRRAPAGDASLK